MLAHTIAVVSTNYLTTSALESLISTICLARSNLRYYCPFSWCMFSLAEARYPTGRFPATELEDAHNHPRQVFPCWRRANICWGNFARVTEEIYLKMSQKTPEQLVRRDVQRSHNSSSSFLRQDYCQQRKRSAGALSSQVLKPMITEHTVSAHLILLQHKLPMQEGFSRSLVWTCQATVHDSCLWCHLPQAGRV